MNVCIFRTFLNDDQFLIELILIKSTLISFFYEIRIFRISIVTFFLLNMLILFLRD